MAFDFLCPVWIQIMIEHPKSCLFSCNPNPKSGKRLRYGPNLHSPAKICQSICIYRTPQQHLQHVAKTSPRVVVTTRLRATIGSARFSAHVAWTQETGKSSCRLWNSMLFTFSLSLFLDWQISVINRSVAVHTFCCIVLCVCMNYTLMA